MKPDQQRRLLLAVVILVLIMVTGLGLILIADYGYDQLTDASSLPDNALDASEGGIDPGQARFLSEEGVLVTAVALDSPFQLTSLQRGHIILAVGDAQVHTVADVAQAMQSYQAGDRVRLLVFTGSKTEEMVGTLIENGYLGLHILEPSSQTVSQLDRPSSLSEPDPSTSAAVASFGYATVARVIPGSPASQSSLQEGDVITAVDENAILTIEELIDYIGGQQPGHIAVVMIRRGPDTIQISIPLTQHPDEPERAFLGIELRPGFPSP